MLAYVYLGYPVLLQLLIVLGKKTVLRGHLEPLITILIPAHNEEESIGATLQNKLSLNYPRQKLEILVVSDASEDRTDDIVQQYESHGVRLIRQNPRAGKTSALNLAASSAKGEILVFSDANSIYNQDALKYLMENFSDPSVGYVTGQMKYVNPDGSLVGDGCSAYMRYENVLRKAETQIGSIVGVDGGIDAVRKSLYQPMQPDQLPDFVLPLKVVEHGYRVVYEPRAILEEMTLTRAEDEYRMRVRVSLRAFWAIWDMRHLLWRRNNLVYAWQLVSHKVLRYLGLVFMASLYVTNLALLLQSPAYAVLFGLQNLFYLSSLIPWFLRNDIVYPKLIRFPYYFALVNWASAHALSKFLCGERVVVWRPRRG
jgi:cellulose synthase/poly-beta-1,6-N-acetylglucosamine synthase-like glycosyltransferase